jgi:hypothetical protein
MTYINQTFVPYYGAISNMNIGAHSINAAGFFNDAFTLTGISVINNLIEFYSNDGIVSTMNYTDADFMDLKVRTNNDVYAANYWGNGVFSSASSNYYGFFTSPAGLLFYLNNIIVGSITPGEWYLLNNNLVTDENVTARYFKGDGSLLTGISNNAWMANNATENRNFLTKGNLTINESIGIRTPPVKGTPLTINTTSGLSGGLRINQGADNSGIIIYGYDDEANQSLFIGHTGSGVTTFIASDAFAMSSSTRYLSMSSVTSSIYLTVGDGAGTQKVYFRNSSSNIVAHINSKGVGNFTGLVVSGNIASHYKSSDGTIGVTASGTSCTITEIKDGIITGATCV